TCAKTSLDQVFNHFVLTVNCDGFSAREFRHVDVMPASLKADVKTVVPQTFTQEPVADANRVHQIHGSLLENAGPHALDYVIAAAILDDDRIDSDEMEKVA